MHVHLFLQEELPVVYESVSSCAADVKDGYRQRDDNRNVAQLVAVN